MLHSQEHDGEEDMAEAPTVTKPKLPSLPTEILQDIAELVSDACGRAGLARASRRLCQVTDPILWRHGVQDNLSEMLVQASTTGNLDILKKSVIYGADIDRPHHVPLPEEAEEYYSELPLSKKDKDYLFWAAPLHLAVYHGHYDAVKWLVSYGADIEAPGYLVCECKGYGDYLSDDGDIYKHSCWTPLHYSICREQDSIIRLLLSAGASVQTMVSADKIRIDDRFDKILRGLRPKVFRSYCTSLSSNVTALHTASEKGMKWLVTHLVRNMQVDVEVTDNSSMTPLFYALLSTDPSMIDNLVWLGADLRWKGLDGRTPLKLAFDCKLWQSAARLQDLGAKLDTDTRRPWSDLVQYNKPSTLGHSTLPGLPEERVRLLCYEKEGRKHEAIARLAQSLGNDCLLMKKAGCEADINRTSEDFGASAELPEINHLAAAFVEITKETWCGTKMLESFLAMGVKLDKDDLAWRADGGGMNLGFKALKAVTERSCSPYKIRFLLQNGADPTNGWRHSAHAETPLHNILYVIYTWVMYGITPACEVCSFQDIIEAANDIGRYGAWDSPSAEERARLFGILEYIEEEPDLSSRQLRLRKQLRDNLIVPHHLGELQPASTWSLRST